MRGGLVVAVATLVLSGCAMASSSGGASPAVTSAVASPVSSAVAAAVPAECPEVLVQDDPPRHGFGTGEPAATAPAIDAPDQAWICWYVTADTGSPDPDGGALYEWRLSAGPVELNHDGIARLSDLFDALTVAPVDRGCTSDLGPRLLLTVAHGADTLALAVDDYGCREIRITDDPWTAAPGAPTDPDLPAGVLVAEGMNPAALLREIGGVPDGS